ncbi:hypothetical protein GW796_05480 [archaeon]|nr:hypothetical protein [archaeon]NCQ51335.1 hypothetical protein [archaeon]NCT58839.1 hypothetical protein [archaeon]PJB18497.1 MAG: hypothetical protein CO117_07980 [Flavobacteriaceae bacterium CG_4_9_14_3_um_filter_33_16]
MPELFDYLKSLTNKKIKYESEEDFKGYSQWMINRYLSTIDSLLPIVSEINREYIISDKAHYNLFFTIIPKSNSYLKYNFKKEKNDKEIEYLMNYFNCDFHLAKTYSELISKEEFEKIISFYEDRGYKQTTKRRKK